MDRGDFPLALTNPPLIECRRWLLVVGLILAGLSAGCRQEWVEWSVDAGMPLIDAGTLAHDAGTVPRDAGAASGDAGVATGDAGVATGDAGVATGDAGAAPSDAGAVPPDDAGIPCPSGATRRAAGQCVLAGPFGMQLAVIPAGTFWMGSPAEEPGRDADETRHAVSLTRNFAMTLTEVTQAQWMAVTGESNPSFFWRCGADCPVERVDWYAALAYANALSAREGLETCYGFSPADCVDEVSKWGLGGDTLCTSVFFVGLDCAGYRLPTEAEWEYAYRAGVQGPYYNGAEPQVYSASEPSIDDMGWYGGNSVVNYDGGFTCAPWFDELSRCGTKPVREREPNAWGLYDMAGNVWEWTWDRYATYGGDASDPAGPASGDARVLRGGSVYNEARMLRAAHRHRQEPDLRTSASGFRLVRTLP